MIHIAKLTAVVLLLLTISGCSSRVTLPVKHLSEESSQGVLTCASMVLAYYGEQISADSLSKLVRKREDFAGIYYVDLVSGLEKIGFSWRPVGYGLGHSGFLLGLAAIKEHLDDGRPVLISTSSPPIGYTLIVVGYDEGQKSLELKDPGAPGSLVMTYDEVENIWHDDFQHNDRWILVTYPRAALR